MKKKLIVLLMFIPLLFSNCDGGDPALDTNDKGVIIYMDYGNLEIPKSSISEVLEFDQEFVEVNEMENVFAITGKKEGLTTLRVKDEKERKKDILVSVRLGININRWYFEGHFVDIDCLDPLIYNEIMADLDNHTIQGWASGNESSVIFNATNTFKLECCSGDNVQTLKGTYSYDLSNLILTITSGETMACRFSIVEELPMSWNAILTHDLTESYKLRFQSCVS